ncbi:MAG: NADPH-dependent oxidoreductase [Acidimicrobiia bacterium]
MTDGPDTSPADMTNPTIDLMAAHVSVRRFTAEPVSDEMVDTILDAARRAPTSSNWQTYSIVVVRDQAIKQDLSTLAGGQGHVADSQVFFVFCADLHRLNQAHAVHGTQHARGLEHTLTPIVDAAIVGEAAQIAAESFGLGAVMVGGIRSNAAQVAQTLGLPREVFGVYGMSVGWPATDPAAGGLKPRLPADLVIHRDQYSDDGAADLIAAYDNALASFYESRGRNVAGDNAWSQPVAQRSTELRYATLRDELEGLGFEFD